MNLAIVLRILLGKDGKKEMVIQQNSSRTMDLNYKEMQMDKHETNKRERQGRLSLGFRK